MAPVLIKLRTGATTRLSKMGYTLPTQAKQVNPNQTWREVLHSVFQITFDESEYRVKLYKQKSSQLYTLHDKVTDLIQEKFTHYPFHTVCLQIKHRGKKQKPWDLSPTPSPPSEELEEDDDDTCSDEDDDNSSPGSTPPPPLTPQYSQREGSDRDEYNVNSDDSQDERSHNFVQREGDNSKLGQPSSYPDWPTPKIDSFGSGDYLGNPCSTSTRNVESEDQASKVLDNCLNDDNSNGCSDSSSLIVENPDTEDALSSTSSSSSLTLKRKWEHDEDAVCPLPNICEEQDDEHISNIRELQSDQEMLSGQLAAARELSGKLESEKFALIKASNAKYLSYERALCESRKNLEAADARMVALEKGNNAEKLVTIGKVQQLQKDLKQVLLQYQDMTRKERKFAEMQADILAMSKKYYEVRHELIQSQKKAEAEMDQISGWVTLAQSFDKEIKTLEDFKGFLLDNNTEMDALRGRNSTLWRRMNSLDGEVDGLRKELNAAKGNETVLRTAIEELEQNVQQVSKERDDLKAKNERNHEALKAVLSATLTAIPKLE